MSYIKDIRKYVELILGETYMFSGSILENIKLIYINMKKINQ